MGKLHAVGSNVMVRVANKVSAIARINPGEAEGIDCFGEIVSVGAKCQFSDGLIGSNVYFNNNMVSRIFGDTEKDEQLFFLVPECALLAAAIPE